MSKDAKNVPALRFKGYSDAWEKRKLGETNSYFTDGNYGESYPKESELSDKENGVPFLRGSNLRNGELIEDNANYITKEKHAELTSGHLVEDDIVLAVRGSLGALGYVKDENIDWNINSQLAVIRTDKSELSGKFLVQFLLSWRGQKELLSRNTGTALKQLPIKQLKDVPVPIVNLDEQKEIGALFSSIDNLIAATQDKLSFLKKMKMFFLQQIFPTKDHDVPQIRFDGFTDAWSHYKLGSLMRIDKEQEVKKELLTDIQKGFYVLAMRTFSMDGYIDHSKPYWLNHLDNVSDDKFLLPREFAILDADMDANLPKIGRVLLNASSEKYLLAAHVRKIQVKSGNDPIFIYALMRGNSVHERLKLEANGSISKRLLDKNVYKQSILVPNRSEQSKIGRLFFLLETTITLHQQKIQMLKQVKKSCLQNLFI